MSAYRWVALLVVVALGLAVSYAAGAWLGHPTAEWFWCGMLGAC